MSSFFQRAVLDQILDDLCARFILNLPQEELISIERICFQIEEAQWYYEDFVRECNPTLPSLSLRQFSAKMFTRCPLLVAWQGHHEEAYDTFLAYKTRVPVRGVILLNPIMDKCVLVKGWKSSAGWSFPRGKINKGEGDLECAIREALEETGYDATDSINSDNYLDINIREQSVRLYIISGVPEESVFISQTRKEISKISWFSLSELPTFRQDPIKDIKKHKFYMVVPFLAPLKKWIRRRNEHEGRSVNIINMDNHKKVPAEDMSSYMKNQLSRQELTLSLKALLCINSSNQTFFISSTQNEKTSSPELSNKMTLCEASIRSCGIPWVKGPESSHLFPSPSAASKSILAMIKPASLSINDRKLEPFLDNHKESLLSTLFSGQSTDTGKRYLDSKDHMIRDDNVLQRETRRPSGARTSSNNISLNNRNGANNSAKKSHPAAVQILKRPSTAESETTLIRNKNIGTENRKDDEFLVGQKTPLKILLREKKQSPLNMPTQLVSIANLSTQSTAKQQSAEEVKMETVSNCMPDPEIEVILSSNENLKQQEHVGYMVGYKEAIDIEYDKQCFEPHAGPSNISNDGVNALLKILQRAPKSISKDQKFAEETVTKQSLLNILNMR